MELQENYAGRWIAFMGERVIGQGGTPDQALYAAKSMCFKETPLVTYIPTSQPLAFSELLDRVAGLLPPGLQVFLVGGAVRDALLGKPVHDLDFVLKGDVLHTARKIADKLRAAYFVLDDERFTARLILRHPEGYPQIFDFASLRGPDLESDLRSRDFTINAMAVDVRHPQALLDPLGGAADMRSKLLRACSQTTFSDDPIRILRAIRHAAALDLHIDLHTRNLMKESTSGLGRISPERLRDEVFRILSGPLPAVSIRALEMLGALSPVFPELLSMKGVEQSPPHVLGVWEHSLDAVQRLDGVLNILAPKYDPEKTTNVATAEISLTLGRYRQQFGEHLESSMHPERPLRGLLLMAALFHDVGKPATSSVDENGWIRFFGHEQTGAKIMAARARSMRLSNAERDRIITIVRHHLRPFLLAQTGKPPSRLAIHRFFRDTGQAGVDICLLSLADVMSTYGPSLPAEKWSNHLMVVRSLLEAWWERPEESISPPPLLTGNDLMDVLNIEPGPEIGRILTMIREAQAAGKLQNREEALNLARSVIENL